MKSPFKADVAVASLAAVATFRVWHVADVERIERHQTGRVVRSESVASVTLRMKYEMSMLVLGQFMRT